MSGSAYCFKGSGFGNTSFIHHEFHNPPCPNTSCWWGLHMLLPPRPQKHCMAANDQGCIHFMTSWFHGIMVHILALGVTPVLLSTGIRPSQEETIHNQLGVQRELRRQHNVSGAFPTDLMFPDIHDPASYTYNHTCALAESSQHHQVAVLLNPFELWRHIAEFYVGLIQNHQHWQLQDSQDLSRWRISLISY